MHAVCVTKPSYNNLRESDMTYIQTDCKLDYQKFIGLVSMVVVHLIASFQAMDDDFARVPHIVAAPFAIIALAATIILPLPP